MSWDVFLGDGAGETLRVADGDAHLAVPYDYGDALTEAWPDERWRSSSASVLEAMLHGRRAGDVAASLRAAAEVLAGSREGEAVAVLADWAEEHPDGVFMVL